MFVVLLVYVLIRQLFGSSYSNNASITSSLKNFFDVKEGKDKDFGNDYNTFDNNGKNFNKNEEETKLFVKNNNFTNLLNNKDNNNNEALIRFTLDYCRSHCEIHNNTKKLNVLQIGWRNTKNWFQIQYNASLVFSKQKTTVIIRLNF